MKKVIFTALAFIAFSGVSMANTVADEEIVKENRFLKESKDSKKILATDCNAFASLVMQIIEDEDDCLDSETYNMYYNFLYERCVEINAN